MLIEKFHPKDWDERRFLIIPGDNNATIIFCVEHFIAASKEAITDHDAFFVALSGGSTPKAIYEHLCKSPYREQIDWKKIYLFWSDERSVPPTDPESNYHMAMHAGFKDMPISKDHIFRMQAESDIEENALKYERTIKEVLKGRPFDLIMLGMGDDGHTASLFPGTEGLKAKNRLVIANHVPQRNTWRISFTYECINSAHHIAIYVLGANKRNMLDRVLKRQEDLPIAKIGTKTNKALWIVDEAAGADLI
jgi:6-phosphogluconolactonase